MDDAFFGQCAASYLAKQASGRLVPEQSKTKACHVQHLKILEAVSFSCCSQWHATCGSNKGSRGKKLLQMPRQKLEHKDLEEIIVLKDDLPLAGVKKQADQDVPCSATMRYSSSRLGNSDWANTGGIRFFEP